MLAGGWDHGFWIVVLRRSIRFLLREEFFNGWKYTLWWLVFFPVPPLALASIPLHGWERRLAKPHQHPNSRCLVPVPSQRTEIPKRVGWEPTQKTVLRLSLVYIPSLSHQVNTLLFFFCKTIISSLWFQVIYNTALPSNNELWRKIMGKFDTINVWRNKWE